MFLRRNTFKAFQTPSAIITITPPRSQFISTAHMLTSPHAFAGSISCEQLRKHNVQLSN